jgi:hypothetical protein
MNSDQGPAGRDPGRLEGEHGRADLFDAARLDRVRAATITYSYDFDAPVGSFTFEHDEERRVFRLTDAEGKTAYFRDKPARYLVVEPDSHSGEMRPATKYGEPVYLYLCREDHEV